MDIRAWVDALTRAGLRSKYSDVIKGFTTGFDQGIPDHVIRDQTTGSPLPFYLPPNHSSARLAAEKIATSIQNEVDQKRMFGPFTREQLSSVFPFFRTSPMGAVINNDGSLRPINDLSYPKHDAHIASVNSFVDPKKFKTTWDDFKVVATFFRQSADRYLLAIFDWEKAYRQIPTLMRQWRYLLVLSTTGEIYIDTRITFGGVAGCGSFGRPADAWKEIMLHEFDVFTIFRWVDDNLFVKRLMSSTRMDQIVSRSQALGVITNKKKCSDVKHEQKFIGFIWNGVEKTVRLPSEKLEKRITQIKTFLSSNTFSHDQVEILTGQLAHVSYILPQLKCYLNSLHRWKAAWRMKFARQKVPDDVREDLDHWLETLQVFKNHRLIPVVEPKEVDWVGDASTSFGIGVFIGEKWCQYSLIAGWETKSEVKRGIAWLETVAIRLGILMILQMKWPGGQRFNVWTDNTTCEEALRKRKLRDRSVNDEWKALQSLLIASQLDINPLRVTSEDNRADALSRGSQTSEIEHNRVRFILPPDLSDFLVST